MFLSSNIYFKGKLHIKNTKHGLYDEYVDVKIVHGLKMKKEE